MGRAKIIVVCCPAPGSVARAAMEHISRNLPGLIVVDKPVPSRAKRNWTTNLIKPIEPRYLPSDLVKSSAAKRDQIVKHSREYSSRIRSRKY